MGSNYAYYHRNVKMNTNAHTHTHTHTHTSIQFIEAELRTGRIPGSISTHDRSAVHGAR